MTSTVPLSQVVDINPRIPKAIDESQPVSFVNMASVSEEGRVIAQEVRALRETKKGLTYFERGDVLLAKITPCFENGKAALTDNLDHQLGFGSTEFHVLRAKPNEIDSKYLFYLIWSDRFRFLGEKAMQGAAGQKRVSTEFLKTFHIPLPTLNEQRRVAAILEKADGLRRKRQQVSLLAQQFLRSIFLDMFGDPVANPKGIDELSIDSFCQIVRGSSPRPKGDSRYYGGPVPRLMVQDLTRDGWFVTPKIDTLTVEGSKKSRPVEAGTVVMAVSGNVGLTSILVVDACIHDGFVAFKNLDERTVLPEFLLFMMTFLKSTHSAREAGAIFKNLTTSQIKEMRIPVPAIPDQMKFVSVLKKQMEIGEKLTRAIENVDELNGSLCARAFSGEL